MKFVTIFFSGFIFSIGLGISGMMNPEKVKNFLDAFGSWDPSLMFVMIGALSISYMAFKIGDKRLRPVLEPNFKLPTKVKIDYQLVIGSSLFGIGWGLGGICPGPAFANLFLGSLEILTFMASMLGGMFLVRAFKLD